VCTYVRARREKSSLTMGKPSFMSKSSSRSRSNSSSSADPRPGTAGGNDNEDGEVVSRDSPPKLGPSRTRRSRGLPMASKTGTTKSIVSSHRSVVQQHDPIDLDRSYGGDPHSEKTAQFATKSNSPRVSPRYSTKKILAGTGSSKEESENSTSSSKNEAIFTSAHISRSQTLIAFDEDSGRTSKVTIVIDSQPFVNQTKSKGVKARKRTRSTDAAEDGVDSPETAVELVPDMAADGSVPLLGHDGNLFHCNVCQGFGDVVCCDGCPNVYHQDCIPKDDPSRISLDKDEEPWYCPTCFPEKTKGQREDASEMSDRKRSVKHRCCECNQSGGPNPLEPCTTCGHYLHWPGCKTSDRTDGDVGATKNALCNSCRSELALKEDEPVIPDRRCGRKRKKSFSVDNDETDEEQEFMSVGDSSSVSNRHIEDAFVTNKEERSKSSIARQDLETPLQDSRKKQRCPSAIGSSSGSKPSTRRKKKKESHGITKQTLAEDEQLSLLSLQQTSGPTKTTPGFFLFLAENRHKIERSLSRKHRTFNRMPKGIERNELVAKEGAHWWIKLPSSEVRRYIGISMREYEQRIIEWKEEKNLRDMMAESDDPDASSNPGVQTRDFTTGDERHIAEMHSRLYLGTNVGCKPFTPEKGESHNRVLLELLQDMRFNPVPMFSATRAQKEHGQTDFGRVSIPYFDVHGPVSTGIGDECLGCVRGWNHFCNVLRRRVPAIEFRAKLQPPLSSLMATRVGLGTRDKAERKSEEEVEEMKNVEAFSVRDTPETEAAHDLPIVPWDSLSNPSKRGDDIISFVEETIAMKIPEPPRPELASRNKSYLDSTKKSLFPSEQLVGTPEENAAGEEDDGDDENDYERQSINKCGRCRTVIQTDLGCIQCRRAQLVINMAKRLPQNDDKFLSSPKKEAKSQPGTSTNEKVKPQTYMLGRINIKDGTGEVQSEGDQAIASWILTQRWMPSAILPPALTQAPTKAYSKSMSSNSDTIVLQKVENEEGRPGETEDPSNAKVDDESMEALDEASDDSNSTGDNSPDQTEGNSRRLRNRNDRKFKVALSAPEIPQADLQKYANKQKQESDELYKNCLEVATHGILLGLMRRDPLRLFSTSPASIPGYKTIIRTPIDFSVIRRRVLRGKYTSLASFVADCRLLCDNALAYNPPGSIYYKTARDLSGVLVEMQKRASDWMGAIKGSHAEAWRNAPKKPLEDDLADFIVESPFESLKTEWPEAIQMLENSKWLHKCISSDFMRTQENETAYYGSVAIRRTAAAAEAVLAPYPNATGIYHTVSRRSHKEDTKLRQLMDKKAGGMLDPVQLKDIPTGREESIIRILRRTQARRLEGITGSLTGCARCDGTRVDEELKNAMNVDSGRFGKSRKKGDPLLRVASSRMDLTTGLASENLWKRIKLQREERAKGTSESSYPDHVDVAVSARGSEIHGWGLYADQPFAAGDIVAEYVGEYVGLAVTDAREKQYQEERIQDYQFRVDDELVIDATKRGGHARYINHNCSPNCVTKIIPGKPPNEHLKRVVIMAKRDIKPREELSYDYQFPLELDMDSRIPCSCHSDDCRGFMNWDMPEKGSNTKIIKGQKRGANMRDRIRRLGRPLKGESEK
jgi:hypothetical protein